MTTIPTPQAYPPATVLDRDNRELATGEAYIDAEKRFAEYFPFRTPDEGTLLARAFVLRITGGETFAVQQIRRCEAIRLGPTNPHYDIEFGH